MLILILAFIVSMIPTVLLFLWIRGQKNIAENYNNNCTKAFVRGLLSVLPVIPTSLVLNIAVDDDLAFIAITLAAISLVFLVLLVRFFKKRRTDEKYLSI
jgi:hypothetical protein